jgi:hypothetical protein
MKIQDARSLSSIAQEDIRRKAIKAVLDDRKQVDVAKLFGVTRQAVGKTRRGKGTKIMAISDAYGLPVAAHIASASPHEVKLVARTGTSPSLHGYKTAPIQTKQSNTDP